jgi:asparagine synthase (glutamine-hydrolysing)
MCGIAGFIGDYDERILHRMAHSIAHRGPDDEGIDYRPHEGVGLVHRRLSIIDLSRLGHQPMWSSNDMVAVVFNGEIYNYHTLTKELAGQGHVFRSQSDTEVLLALYQRDGTNMLSRLNGIFAFAIWDGTSDTLFLARDGLGVKPLYYANTPRGLVFASELKALLAAPDLDRTIDCAALQYHLTYLWCPAPRTMLRGVHKLEPGSALLARSGRVERRWQHYELPYGQEIDQVDVSAAAERVRETLRRAVERQMVADVPVGAFLSGGLDSSAIVTFAREYTGRSALQCFTIGFNDKRWQKEGMANDLPYAERVARDLGVALHTIYVGPEMADQLEKMIYHLDEPQADPAALNVMFISRLARQHGIKVLLSGAGGDDIFTGYRRHRALMLERYWAWTPVGVRNIASKVARKLPQSLPACRRISRALRYGGLEQDERLLSYFYWTPPEEVRNLLSRDVRKTLETGLSTDPLEGKIHGFPFGMPAINKMLYFEAKYFLADHNLNYTDKMAMAEGIEVRVPFLDPDVVALGARMPVNFKQRGCEGKWILKKAMEPYLPRDVIYRPKTGFGAPVRSWMRRELRGIVDDTLSREALIRRGLFEPDVVAELIRNDRMGRADSAYTILSLLCVELWCRMFLDKPVQTG